MTYKFTIHATPNQSNFRGEKSAKVIGKLAAQTLLNDDQEISGILVKKNFKYHLMSPEDLQNYTDMAISSIIQRQSIPIKCDVDFLIASLQRIFGNVKSASGRYRFFDLIDLIFENNYIVLEWNSSPINDFYADSILAEILKLEIDASSSSVLQQTKELAKEKIKTELTLEKNFLNTLGDMFGELKVEKQNDNEELIVNIDEHEVHVNLKELNVKCETNKQTESQVQNVLNQLRNF
jgi:cleavage and polyadenylation specificity factor subunit 3